MWCILLMCCVWVMSSVYTVNMLIYHCWLPNAHTKRWSSTVGFPYIIGSYRTLGSHTKRWSFGFFKKQISYKLPNYCIGFPRTRGPRVTHTGVRCTPTIPKDQRLVCEFRKRGTKFLPRAFPHAGMRSVGRRACASS